MRALVYDPGHEPNIGWRGSWERVDAAARALLDRRVTGKAVLDVRGGEAR